MPMHPFLQAKTETHVDGSKPQGKRHQHSGISDYGGESKIVYECRDELGTEANFQKIPFSTHLAAFNWTTFGHYYYQKKKIP